jgi:hypothetical protein
MLSTIIQVCRYQGECEVNVRGGRTRQGDLLSITKVEVRTRSVLTSGKVVGSMVREERRGRRLSLERKKGAMVRPDHPVLDMHVHPPFPTAYTPEGLSYAMTVNPEGVALLEKLQDPDDFLEYFHGLGVDQVVVLAEEAPLVSGMVMSEDVVDFAARAEGLHAFVSFNPHLTLDPLARLEALRERGRVAGVKFLPSYQHFWPNDRRLYPLYSRLEELRLPVTFHTGLSRFRGTKLKYAQPILFDELAVDFPALPILLAHAGRGVWYGEAALLATLHEHVYLEMSGLPPRNIPSYFPRLENLVDKLVFGSDFPGVPSIPDNLRELRQVLGPEAARKVLWENGARLLGLDLDEDAC